MKITFKNTTSTLALMLIMSISANSHLPNTDVTLDEISTTILTDNGNGPTPSKGDATKLNRDYVDHKIFIDEKTVTKLPKEVKQKRLKKFKNSLIS